MAKLTVNRVGYTKYHDFWIESVFGRPPSFLFLLTCVALTDLNFLGEGGFSSRSFTIL